MNKSEEIAQLLSNVKYVLGWITLVSDGLIYMTPEITTVDLVSLYTFDYECDVRDAEALAEYVYAVWHYN